jgi:hypothetical protein
MGKRELKKQYTELDFNFVDLVSLLDTTPTKKMTPFLVKQFNDWIQYREGGKRVGLEEMSSEYETMRRTLGDPKNELDEIVKRMVFKWAQPKLEVIKEFTEHMEANRLEESDINKYENWNAIKIAVNEAEIKQGVKNKKNRVDILHSDDEWLILKPLSMEASVNYGYGTKWCTSMRDSNSYFHRYSRNGVLVFIINRKNGVKYAIYSSPKEFSVWTATDARIDSMETTIPFDLMMRMKEWTNFDEVGPNYNYFEDEDKENNRLNKLVSIRPLRDGRNNNPIEATLDEIEEGEMMVEDMVESDEMAVPSSGNVFGHTTTNETTSFNVGSWSEVPMETHEEHEYAEPMVTREWNNETEDPISVHVDIRDRGETMVGMDHTTHGSITEQGERTWDNPYPTGAGGGFNVGGEIMEEMESMDEESYDNSDELHPED